MRETMPLWAQTFVDEGRIPEKGTPEYHAFLGWKFFGDRVPGLPDEGTKAAAELLARASDA